MEAYRTVAAPASGEFVERRSRFIGAISPVQSEEQAADFIAEVRTRHWDAAHNCYAYILQDGQVRRYSDDGEPQGTAGVPILEVLQREELSDVCVVVTRYFGGVLLGAGGLVRAYSHGAKIAVDSAAVVVMSPCVRLEIGLDYSQYGKLTHLLPRYGAKVEFSAFEADIRLTVLLKEEFLSVFEKALDEMSGATLSPRVTGRLYADLAD